MKNTVTCHNRHKDIFEVAIDKVVFRPSVYGILIEDNKILLSKQWDGYDLPGGGINIDETIHEALKREFFEETGLTVSVLTPVHCETSFYRPMRLNKDGTAWNCQLVYFLVKEESGTLSKDNFDEYEKEYADMPEWIDLDKIPTIKFYNSIDDPSVIAKAVKLKTFFETNSRHENDKRG